MVADKGMNYFTAIADKSANAAYGVRGLPTVMSVGADGKIISTNARKIADSAVEKLLEDLVPKKIDVEVSKKAKNAAKAYDGGDYSKALSEAKKIKDKEGVEADDLVGVDRIIELVGLQSKGATTTIEKMITDKDFLKLDEYVDKYEKAFKDTDATAAFTKASEKLKEKDVKEEIKALKALAKIEEGYVKAGNNARKQQAAIKQLQSLVKKNEGTKAAEKAAALLTQWESALPVEGK